MNLELFDDISHEIRRSPEALDICCRHISLESLHEDNRIIARYIRLLESKQKGFLLPLSSLPCGKQRLAQALRTHWFLNEASLYLLGISLQERENKIAPELLAKLNAIKSEIIEELKRYQRALVHGQIAMCSYQDDEAIHIVEQIRQAGFDDMDAIYMRTAVNILLPCSIFIVIGNAAGTPVDVGNMPINTLLLHIIVWASSLEGISDNVQSKLTNPADGRFVALKNILKDDTITVSMFTQFIESSEQAAQRVAELLNAERFHRHGNNVGISEVASRFWDRLTGGSTRRTQGCQGDAIQTGACRKCGTTLPQNAYCCPACGTNVF